MTPHRARRARLLKGERPYIRSLNVYDGHRYHADIGILWAAHTRRPFVTLAHISTQAQFADYFSELIKTHQAVLVEDANRAYKSGRGPVALAAWERSDWRVEPHSEMFAWASPRNVLRATVQFLHWLRSLRSVGCCVICALKESRTLLDHACQYGVLHYNGAIRNGSPFGDEFIYSIKGLKHAKLQARVEQNQSDTIERPVAVHNEHRV